MLQSVGMATTPTNVEVAPHTVGVREKKCAAVRSRHIDHQIDQDRDQKQREVQLLILGGAGSGKSTFIKQLRIHHGDGFPVAERERLKSDVSDNVIDAFHIVLANIHILGLGPLPPDSQKLADNLKELYPYFGERLSFPGSPQINGSEADTELVSGLTRFRPSTADLPPQLQGLWEDSTFQKAYTLREKFEEQLSETEQYFLMSFKDIASPGYVPSVQDLLHVRKPTVGVQEHSFRVQEFQFRVIDVAGQRSQRKKWIHFFDGVTGVIFFVPLSGFNECLEEDQTLNKLQDSLQLFSEVTHNKYLLKIDFILFLNKHDLFLQKLESGCSIRTAFPEYQGDHGPESSIKYIRNQFFKLAPDKKMIYPHVSCAIDIEMMRVIIEDVLQIIMEINLKKAALI